jgi:hypothetical protein
MLDVASVENRAPGLGRDILAVAGRWGPALAARKAARSNKIKKMIEPQSRDTMGSFITWHLNWHLKSVSAGSGSQISVSATRGKPEAGDGWYIAGG